MTEEQTEAKPITLQAGTLIATAGSSYRMKFPAKFYPSKRDPFSGEMLDRWGNRSLVTVIDPILTDEDNAA